MTVAKKDDNTKLSEKKYHEILAERNQAMNRGNAKVKRETVNILLPDGVQKTKHIDRCTWKNKNGKELATKTYCMGVEKREGGSKRIIVDRGI